MPARSWLSPGLGSTTFRLVWRPLRRATLLSSKIRCFRLSYPILTNVFGSKIRRDRKLNVFFHNRSCFVIARAPGTYDMCHTQLVMNYLVVEGYRDAAAHFLEESGTEPKVDLRTIEERVAIRKVGPNVEASSEATSFSCPGNGRYSYVVTFIAAQVNCIGTIDGYETSSRHRRVMAAVGKLQC